VDQQQAGLNFILTGNAVDAETDSSLHKATSLLFSNWQENLRSF
jgi:hypothetical protein